MKKFLVTTEWSGYSRGTATYEVEAETADEARELLFEGKQINREVVRDDTESEIESVKEIT